MKHRVAIIGGGAAGFFAALACKAKSPDSEVVIYEKAKKVLSKVKVSGGGRCNVTNACFSIPELSRHYPRGGRFLKKAFHQFYTEDTVQWFETRGVRLVTQEDNCMFPKTQSSQTIIDCFWEEARALGVQAEVNARVSAILPQEKGFSLVIREEQVQFDKVIVTTGGHPKRRGFEWLETLGHSIVEPVPSLFTFNMPDEPVTELMGIVVEPASVRIQGTKLKSRGPLLITHWGMSGPAILLLSAWGARILCEKKYTFSIQVNWLDQAKDPEVRGKCEDHIQEFPKRQLASRNPFYLPNRLWTYLLQKTGLAGDSIWSEVKGKKLNRLVNTLLNDVYHISGKTTFKEEFVTCGGVALDEIDVRTMESKVHKGLYFAGEVMDIDGVTGGFNFQAAWTTGYIAGCSAASPE